MELLLILFLGATHGVQPDHAVAAGALASRMRVPTWVAALRLAVGHCLALLMIALLFAFLPKIGDPRIERVLEASGAAALILLGGVLLHRVWRNGALAHSHSHEHSRFAKGPLAVAFGWILGLGGMRAIVVLPLMAGPHGLAAGLLAYSGGLSAGILATSVGVDWLRRLTGGWLSRRLVDGVFAVSAMACGGWLLICAERI